MSAPTRRRVLVADDSTGSLEQMHRVLTRGGYEVLTARRGEDAAAAAGEHVPDVLLMDVGLVDGSIQSVVRDLRMDERTRHVPILFVSDAEDVAQMVRCLTEGANDYITRPFHAAELLARVGVAIRIKDLQDALRERNEQLAALVLIDQLTGTYTRHHLEQRLEEEVTRAQRYSQPLACLMLDLDHFKQVNDSYGHQMGDAVLRQLGAILCDAVRAADVVARYGGEEFVMVCPQTPSEGARSLAERVRRSVAAATLEAGARTLSCTVSIGIAAAAPGMVPDGEKLLRAADSALYRAKENGRNRVELDRLA